MRNIFFTLFFIYSTAAFTQQWQDVGGGIDLWVNVMKVDTVSDLLYVGGDFSSAGGISANSIAKWDGTTWQIIGNNEKFSGVGSINDIAFFNGDLIVAGLFDSVGNTKVNNIARFDGTQWQPISYGFDDEVYALEVFNGELYAGGTFFHSGLDTTPHIAKWNGNVWQPVGDGLFGGYVFSLKAFNNKLCVGGQGFYSLSQSLPCVAIWDNITWQPLGNGFNNYVGKLNVFQNELYAVGDFTPWAMNPSTRISRWDGNAWQSMPFPTGGTDQRITDLCEYNNKMYVCGFFNNPPDLARYNGIDYDSLCDVTGFINNLAVYKNELYVGGLFNAINSTPRFSIARFNEGTGISESVFSNGNEILVYPNPSTQNQETSVILKTKKFDSHSSLELKNAFGQSLNEFVHFTTTENKILLGNLNPGVYFLSWYSNNINVTSKLIISQ